MLAFVFSLIIPCLVLARPEYKYETKWFTVPIEHFSFTRNDTFKIKYLVNEDYWDRNGPIFFYTGNEGQIEVFANNTGFMWDIAAEFKAKLVFAEHRYYGDSMPFGDKSLDNGYIEYLSSSQALADYALLVNELQGNGQRSNPVIAFGGSYGGMLAAYFRMKYPHLVSGAIAASAPVHMFTGMVDYDVFNRIVTSSFKMKTTNCTDNIRKSWSLIRNYTSTANSTEWLRKNWNLCDQIKNASDTQTLIDFLENMYVTLAMVNYPFPTDFLMPLPAEPVQAACEYLKDNLNGEKLLEAIGKIIDLYTNYNKNNKCVDYKRGNDYGNLNATGWDFQACTEMVMPQGSTGVSDMFEPQPWNYTKFAEDCHKKYNVYPQPYLAKILYGGDKLNAASNIVFSNGLLDPWAGGGILNSSSKTIKAILIVDGAHHLDLMAKNPADPSSVLLARDFHKQNIHKWIREWNGNLVS